MKYWNARLAAARRIAEDAVGRSGSSAIEEAGRLARAIDEGGGEQAGIEPAELGRSLCCDSGKPGDGHGELLLFGVRTCIGSS